MAGHARSAASTDADVVVTGVGLVTAIGFDAPATTMAVRAGITRARIIPDFLTDGGEAKGVAALGLTDERSGSDRLLTLAVAALQEALEQAEREGDELRAEDGALILALPPSDRPAYETFDAGDLADLLEQAECEGLREVLPVPGGHTATLRGVEWAAQRLRQGKVSFAIVGGVDCLLENPGLLWLDENDRLCTEARADGLIPGEAAAFLVLERAADARARGARPLARLAALGFAREDAPHSSATPSRAHGLSRALRAVLAQYPGGPDAIRHVLCDLNGESYRMREWAMCYTRVLPRWTGEGLRHPVENFGDLGTASGAALVALGTTLLDRGLLREDPVLIWCSADDGDRACLLLERGT
jgi:3-oxoacyl-[acyl-carrier-protein] synthase-1